MKAAWVMKVRVEDDQEGIHHDENGRDDDDEEEEEEDGNHGNYNSDYKVPRLQQVQQRCKIFTKRKDNDMLQIIYFYSFIIILHHRINNNKYNKKHNKQVDNIKLTFLYSQVGMTVAGKSPRS